jgi:hypothetical protein
MSNILSVSALATAHADHLWNGLSPKPKGKQDVFVRRASWDFAVTGFNLTTLLTIVGVALAVFFSSPFFALVAFLAFQARGSFMQYLQQLVAPHHIKDNPTEVAQILEQSSKSWQPIERQFLDFRIWMNWTFTM